MSPEPRRHVAAVMSTDIAGPAARTRREDDAVLEAQTRHQAILRDAVTSHGGEVVQSLSGGSTSVFPSAAEAVRAAIAMQQALSGQPSMPVRIGIHHGESTNTGHAIAADTVDVASRLRDVSVPGGILVTDQVRDEMRHDPELALVPLGPVKLEGVRHPVAVYAVAVPGVAVPDASELEREGERSLDPVDAVGGAPSIDAKAATRLRQRLAAALAGDYDIEDLLDTGGAGLVFAARDRVLGRRVAVKLLRPELATEPAVERFLREARILAGLRHPAIVPVHRAGEADGLPYYVMDYLEGETLADRLRAGPLPSLNVYWLGLALLDGLAAAHRVGVIHRDVKPSNLFLGGGAAVLTDFGIAYTETGPEDSSSGTHRAGTPGYMPPEQAAGEEVTALTDIHAAGMVLYEALTGRRWSAGLDPAVSDWSGVPRAWVGPLKRALARTPAERWASATTFRTALVRSVGRPTRGRIARVARNIAIGVGALVAMTLLCGPAPSRAESSRASTAESIKALPAATRGGRP